MEQELDEVKTRLGIRAGGSSPTRDVAPRHAAPGLTGSFSVSSRND
jgi:hypothetical protein